MVARLAQRAVIIWIRFVDCVFRCWILAALDAFNDYDSGVEIGRGYC
jgi:hypothetical protein